MKFHIQVRDHSLGDLENGISQGKEGQESTENLVFFFGDLFDWYSAIQLLINQLNINIIYIYICIYMQYIYICTVYI